MSKVSITRSKLDALANTISTKSGAALPLTLDQMDAAVQSIDLTTGSVYQDQDGFLVVDDGESSAPQGNVSITANGTYDVASYARATVDVVKTYTATISGTGNATYCWVQVNATGTKYYTDGDTFTFADGDYLYIAYRCTVAGGYVAEVTVNGEVAASVSGTTGTRYYTVHDPQCNMEIEISYGANTTVNLVVPSAMVASITENGISSIGGSAFVSVAVSGMSETELKDYIERTRAFTDIEWPEGITRIGSHAFAQCTNFNPASLPSGITVIDPYAFYNCFNLALTSLPSGVTQIGSYAFYSCGRLALSSLPDGIRTINDYAFYDCENLALTSLPSSATLIGQQAFRYCYNLALTSLPSGVTSIGDSTFDSCYKLAISTIPSGVTSIGIYAFRFCEDITTISCDGAITKLGSNAFNGSSSHPMQLTSASFPNMALTASLGSVFGSTTASSACQQLEFCDIGSSAGITSNAFANCYKLQTLVLRKTASVCALTNVSAFLNTPMRGYNDLTGKVYVPSALISAYQTATNWTTLYNAGTVEFVAIEGSEYERD